MEGPSLQLANEQLQPFVGKKILSISGNTKVGKERMDSKKVLEIFSWGKHLVFQFDTFAMFVHFMMFGSFRAKVDGESVTGDYKVKSQAPRLVMKFKNGEIEMFSCSIRYIEEPNAKSCYDFTMSIMSPKWDGKVAMKKVLARGDSEIADVLLDQTIFAGVGNIIKNEVLFLARTNPLHKVSEIPKPKLREIVKLARTFSIQFYKWRKRFVLRKHLVIYRKGVCPICGSKVIRGKTGKTERWTFYCPKDQI